MQPISTPTLKNSLHSLLHPYSNPLPPAPIPVPASLTLLTYLNNQSELPRSHLAGNHLSTMEIAISSASQRLPVILFDRVFCAALVAHTLYVKLLL